MSLLSPAEFATALPIHCLRPTRRVASGGAYNGCETALCSRPAEHSSWRGIGSRSTRCAENFASQSSGVRTLLAYRRAIKAPPAQPPPLQVLALASISRLCCFHCINFITKCRAVVRGHSSRLIVRSWSLRPTSCGLTILHCSNARPSNDLCHVGV
jgi:hypothetical protein